MLKVYQGKTYTQNADFQQNFLMTSNINGNNDINKQLKSKIAYRAHAERNNLMHLL